MLKAPDSIREWIAYDPQTGIFTWLRSPGVGVRQGSRAGYSDDRGYRSIRFQGINYREARLAWFFVTDTWPPELVDHINLDRGDNRFINLRLASSVQNGGNQRKRAGVLKGVSLDRGRYRARIRYRGRLINLGSFGSAEEANAAYGRAAENYFGEFARTR